MSDLFTDKPQLKEGWHSHLVDGLTGPCVTCGAVQRWVVPVVRCEHGNIDPHEYAEPCGETHAEIPGHCGVTALRDCPGSPTLNKGEDE